MFKNYYPIQVTVISLITESFKDWVHFWNIIFSFMRAVTARKTFVWDAISKDENRCPQVRSLVFSSQCRFTLFPKKKQQKTELVLFEVA